MQQEANSEDVVCPLSISLVHGQVDRTYSIGTGAWSATSRKITSHSQADAFKREQWVSFASTNKLLCFRIEYAKPVELLSIRAAGNAWMSKRPGHQLTLYDENMAIIAETCVHSDDDINMYMEVVLEPQDKTAAHGKVFYLEEKHDLCILRNYNVVARPFRPAIPKGAIMDDVHSLFNNKELSDLTVVVEGKPIYCNRAMLAVRCPVFKAMLYGPMREGQQKTISIPEARHEVFLRLIEYLYTDDIRSELEADAYVELLMLGEQYNLPRLKAMCGVKLKQSISVNKVSTLLMTAHRHNSQQLKDLCIQYICEHHTEVVKSKDFKVLAEEPELLMEVTVKISLDGKKV